MTPLQILLFILSDITSSLHQSLSVTLPYNVSWRFVFCFWSTYLGYFLVPCSPCRNCQVTLCVVTRPDSCSIPDQSPLRAIPIPARSQIGSGNTFSISAQSRWNNRARWESDVNTAAQVSGGGNLAAMLQHGPWRTKANAKQGFETSVCDSEEEAEAAHHSQYVGAMLAAKWCHELTSHNM